MKLFRPDPTIFDGSMATKCVASGTAETITVNGLCGLISPAYSPTVGIKERRRR
jgi:hypothetical protein